MHRNISILFLLTFLQTTSGEGDNTTSTPSVFVDVNGIRIEQNDTRLLEYIHNIYDSIVHLSNDFSRFPMSDEYDPVKVSMFFIITNTRPCNTQWFLELLSKKKISVDLFCSKHRPWVHVCTHNLKAKIKVMCVLVYPSFCLRASA